MATILVIDDCEEFRTAVRELLEDAGHSVFAVGDPGEAFGPCKSGDIDVILCDLVMPMHDADVEEEDGLESPLVGVHAIAELARECPKVPIVAVSGHLTGEPLRAMAQFGAFACLSKPFGKEELMASIDRALLKRSGVVE